MLVLPATELTTISSVSEEEVEAGDSESSSDRSSGSLYALFGGR